MFVTAIVLVVTYWICNYVPFGETRAKQFGYMFIRGIICIIIPNILYTLIYANNKQFVESKEWVVGIVKSKFKHKV